MTNQETGHAYGSPSGYDELPEGTGATATDSGGYGTTSAEPEPVELPTVEYGGPDIEPSEEVNYGELPEDSHGPRPTLPPEVETPLYYESSDFSEDDDEKEEGVTELDSDPFALGDFLALSKEEIVELIVKRIKVLEGQKVDAGLRRFELAELNGEETNEYQDVHNQLVAFTRLQNAYQRAYTDFTADRQE